MPENGLYASLPPYLRRYLATWNASFDENESWQSFTLSSSDEVTRFYLDERHARGVKYLALTIRDVRFAALEQHELIDRLAEVPGIAATASIVTELARRLPGMSEDSKGYLATILCTIGATMQEPGGRRTAADRSLMRLLYRMDSDAAFRPAGICARSERTIRREASYRFYLKYGLDDTACEILAAQIHPDSERYCRVITTHAGIIHRLGLANVLLLAPSSYWRMRAISCALQMDDDAKVLATCEDYPLELTWAVNTGCIKRLLPQMLELLDRYAADAYLLNRILQCLAVLGDPVGLARGIELAANALERAELKSLLDNAEKASAAASLLE